MLTCHSSCVRAASTFSVLSRRSVPASLAPSRGCCSAARAEWPQRVRAFSQAGPSFDGPSDPSSQLGPCVEPRRLQQHQASSSTGQRGGNNDDRDSQPASTSASHCSWPYRPQQLDVSFQSARCAILTSSFDDEGSSFDFPEEDCPGSEQPPCPHEAHAVAWDGSLLPHGEHGEELTLLPGQVPAHTLSDLSHWCGSSSHLQAPVMPNIHELEQVFVLLFGVGSDAVEGVHTIRALDHDHGSASDTVVAFEAHDDAERYATLLEASMAHAPQVSSIQVPELLEFCADAGHRFRLEATGTLLIPPSFNVMITDWERSIRLRNGEFTVLETDPLVAASSGAPAPGEGVILAEPSPPQTPPRSPTPSFSSHSEAQRYTDAAMEEIRQRLELLLAEPDTC